MFTGLVQGMGNVTAFEQRGGQMRLSIRALFPLPEIVRGESIAVNGACLTVENSLENAFTAYASAETLDKTNLRQLTAGSKVNLERALAIGDRLGGHMVSGHVDCLAQVDSSVPSGESVRYTFGFPPEFGVFVVEKGSVCLDGISLTVNECGQDWLCVNIIPATQAETTIAGWAPSQTVNMETDLIGKYVARMLGPFAAKARPSNITDDFLKKYGF